MAGYTDSAFRLLCREFGADLVMTELVSADAIAYGKFGVEKNRFQIDGKELTYNQITSSKNHPTAEILSFFDEERPLVVQLFGKHPEKFALATKWITENLKPDGIDINMGCPARKVVNSDHGAALLKNPGLATQIVVAVKNNTDLPVSVKTRLGWETDDEILSFVPKLKAAGIESIMIHGRTYKDGFKNTARWENIYRVKEMFGDSLIVIGNGDIGPDNNSKILVDQLVGGLNYDSQIKLDGVAIGRATFGKPWIFSKTDMAKSDLKKLILRHATLSFLSKKEKGLIEFRKHLLCYLKGFEGAKDLRKKAVSIEKITDIQEIIELL